jgi:succinyl-CoA synthetase beta subunit
MDVAAAAAALAALTRVIAEHPELAELEVNPLLVLPRGAVALDARAVPAIARPSPTSQPSVPRP